MIEWLTSIEDTHWLLAAVVALPVAIIASGVFLRRPQRRSVVVLAAALLIASTVVIAGSPWVCEGHDRFVGDTYPC